jgi:hypothetical protein
MSVGFEAPLVRCPDLSGAVAWWGLLIRDGAFMGPCPPINRIGTIDTGRRGSARTSCDAIPPSVGDRSPSGNQEREAGLTSIDGEESRVNCYPADEGMIWEVERGRRCDAVLPMPHGMSLTTGDSIVFALAYASTDNEMCYARGGDSVRVKLTGVSDLGTTDPATGRALFRFSWEPL